MYKVKKWLMINLIFLISQLIFINATLADSYIPETTPLFDHVLSLPVNLNNGKRVFYICSTCHLNNHSNFIPQLTGQHRNVIIKELTDFVSGKRSNKIMSAVMMNKHLGNPQNIADVASYASSLAITTNTHGLGNDLELGKDLFRVHCIKCHKKNGRGNNKKLIPRLQGQHYEYMLSQFIRVRNGQRNNIDIRMRQQIAGFSFREMQAVIDYASRLK